MRSAGVILLLFGMACQQTRADASASLPAPHAALILSSAPPGAQAALDEIDVRAPLPLLPMMANHQKQNMRDHLLAVQEIVAAVAIDDFSGVERAAARIGFSDSMAQMCTHMGTGAPGFTERALEFHHTADAIAEAARQYDRPAVLGALGKTLSACTSCHAAFKQNVVDEATWNRLGTAPAAAHRRE